MKTVKPLFKMKEYLTCSRSEQINKKNFSKYFGNVVQNLGIYDATTISSDNVTLRNTIEKYQNHPSIKVMLENIGSTNKLSFDMIKPMYALVKLKIIWTHQKLFSKMIFQQKLQKITKTFLYFLSASFNNAVN